MADFLFDIGKVLLDFDFESSLAQLLPTSHSDPKASLTKLLDKKDEFEAGEGRFLELVAQENAKIVREMKGEVESGVQAAFVEAMFDQDQAISDLKILLEAVDRAIDLDVDTRAELRRHVSEAIEQIR